MCKTNGGEKNKNYKKAKTAVAAQKLATTKAKQRAKQTRWKLSGAHVCLCVGTQNYCTQVRSAKRTSKTTKTQLQLPRKTPTETRKSQSVFMVLLLYF